MAIGDAAGAAGLTTYGDSLLVKDIDDALNQRGDELAALIARTKALEALTIGIPQFSVSKSTNGQNLPHDSAVIFGTSAWATPTKNQGGFTWGGGVLTVPRAGVYAVRASMKPNPDDYYAAYVKVTRNSTSANATDTAAGPEVVYPGNEGSNNNPLVSPSITATRLLVNLNAGDALRVVGYQRNYGGQTVGLSDGSQSLTFEVSFQSGLDA